MDWLDFLIASRIFVGIGFLCYAACMDLKYRKVKNKVWIAMGGCGIIMLEIQMLLANLSFAYHLILIPIVVLFSDAFVEREELIDFKQQKINYPWLTAYLAAVLVVVYQLYKIGFEYTYLQFLTVPIMICVAYLLYFSGLLYGGGDAKALMSIAILTPVYPVLQILPAFNPTEVGTMVSVLFPFALVVLLNAVILTAFLPIAFAIYNLTKGEFEFPVAFLGYKINLTDLKKKYVWLMDRFENGCVKRTLTSYKRKVSAYEYSMLQKIGLKRVWVTPQLPFILPLTVSFVISVLIGNILFRLFGFLIGW